MTSNNKTRKDLVPRDERLRLNLSARDRAAFFAALIDPPAPGARLVRAFAEYRNPVVP